MTTKYYNKLAYEEIGDESNPIILFLHPKLLDKWVWIKQKENHEKYFKDYLCIFLDLPHHGDSIYSGEFSIEESCDDIIEFIENLINENNKSKINLVALGLGGSIAIEIISKKPNLIDNLILSGLEISESRENEEESVVKRLAKTQAEYLNEKPDRFIIKAYLRYFGISKDYYEDMEKILDRSVKEEEKIAFESLNYTIPENLISNNEILKKENILFIFGNKEDLNCTKSAICLKNLFENGKLVEIEKGNHLWNIIEHELFNTTIIDFIKSNHIEENDKVKLYEKIE